MNNRLKSYLPPACIFLLNFIKKEILSFSKRKILNKNRSIKDIHKDERCFILCNGPSVNIQNLLLLKDEIVISVSSGYLHDKYSEIKPRYHVIPNITFGKFTHEHAIAWFREMDQHLLSDILFLGTEQYSMVKKSGLLASKNIHYIGMYGDFNDNFCIPRIDTFISGVQSVPILAIMIAMYMGFNKIYLLGTDHDWFIKKNYSYAFAPTIAVGTDPGVKPNGNMPELLLADELPIAAVLWNQYRALHRIAEANNIKIYNASAGGALDEFDLIDFESLMTSNK
jgi:hypothetical protein